MSFEKCELCPRNCGVNRSLGEVGYCKSTNKIIVAQAGLFYFEEPCLSGKNGSGAIFFSGCNLNCVYCQNFSISHEQFGKEITIERLSEIFLELQKQGANNINLVTPTHFVREIIIAIKKAKENGLHLPIIYNTSGYEKKETIALLKGYIDIYLPDFKYYSNEIASKYSNASDYPFYVKDAISEMVDQVGEATFDQNGMMIRGVIVRHLLLPGQLKDAKKIVKYLYDSYQDKIFISLMNQYTPLEHVKKYKELNRIVSEEEYDELVNYAVDIGVTNGFIQEGETQKTSFIPPFNLEGV